jgi:hypothetical protein
VVAAGLAEECTVQLAYAIGVAEPVGVYFDTHGTGQVDESRIEAAVRKLFPLTPRGIIETLKLRRPIFRATAAFGHFGREEKGFEWEKTDRAEALREELLGKSSSKSGRKVLAAARGCLDGGEAPPAAPRSERKRRAGVQPNRRTGVPGPVRAAGLQLGSAADRQRR